MENYHVIIGRLKDIKHDDYKIPHLELLVDVDSTKYRASINLRSKHKPHNLLYKKIDNYKGPILKELKKLNHGCYEITSDKLAIDYSNPQHVPYSKMKKVPYRKNGPMNDLYEYLFSLFNKAINNPFMTLYIFGEVWGPKSEADYYFGNSPSNGIHDIHKKQYNFRIDESYANDGCILIREFDRWTAIFLAFQDKNS